MSEHEEGNVIHFEPPPGEARRREKRHRQSTQPAARVTAQRADEGHRRLQRVQPRDHLLRPIPRPNIKAPKTFEPRAWADADDTALAEHFNSRGFPRVGRNLVRDVIELEARSHPFHPVRDYLEGLQWDGTPRLSRFLLDYCGAVVGGEDTAERDTGGVYAGRHARVLHFGGRPYLPARLQG